MGVAYTGKRRLNEAANSDDHQMEDNVVKCITEGVKCEEW